MAATDADVALLSWTGCEDLSGLADLKRRLPDASVVLVAAAGAPLPPRTARAGADRTLRFPVDPAELRRVIDDCRARGPGPAQQQPPILFVGRERRGEASLHRALSSSGFPTVVASSEQAALDWYRREPRTPLVIIDMEDDTADPLAFALQATCEILAIAPSDADEAALARIRDRTSDFVFRPVSDRELVTRVRRLLDRRRPPGGGLQLHLEGGDRSIWLRTRNAAMERVLERLHSVAPTDATVLLRGETGTGKELLARLLHSSSARRNKPFFALDCGALHESLIESELFGHERGAFTGAVQRKRGLVELAEGGTLFLDEIGELPMALQVKLLRLLQQREFMRVGGEEVLRCNVRVIAATHRNLERMIAEGRFRADLYYRIQVLPLHVPPLRERLEDLPDLAAFLLRRLAAEHQRPAARLSSRALAKLLGHAWPGNIRELENVLERALLLSGHHEVRDLDIDFDGRSEPLEAQAPNLATARSHSEREFLVRLLVRHRGNVKSAAAAAAVNRRTLYRHMRALRIDPSRYRKEETQGEAAASSRDHPRPARPPGDSPGQARSSPVRGGRSR